MGNHFFQYDYSQDQDCNKVFPAQIVYEDNLLKGFVWQHVADIAGDRFVSFIHFDLLYSLNLIMIRLF